MNKCVEKVFLFLLKEKITNRTTTKEKVKHATIPNNRRIKEKKKQFVKKKNDVSVTRVNG